MFLLTLIAAIFNKIAFGTWLQFDVIDFGYAARGTTLTSRPQTATVNAAAESSSALIIAESNYLFTPRGEWQL